MNAGSGGDEATSPRLETIRLPAGRIAGLGLATSLIGAGALITVYAAVHARVSVPSVRWFAFAVTIATLVAVAGGLLHVLRPAWGRLDRDLRRAKAQSRSIQLQLEQRAQSAETYAHELEQSVEDLRRFAYVASHDLKEPIRTVVSHLQLLERTHSDQLDEDARERIRYAEEGARRMKNLLEGLLRYTEVGTRGEAFERVDLDEVLQAAIDGLAVRIEETQADIHTDPLPELYGDETQLVQLFQNLLENAIKFSGEEPPVVRVRAHSTGDEWVVEIEDEGIGFDADTEQRIFEMFQRADTAVQGTGVGLAVCERIVHRHHGEIWAEATPGEGATFKMRFPTPKEDEGPPKPLRLGETEQTLAERTRELI